MFKRYAFLISWMFIVAVGLGACDDEDEKSTPETNTVPTAIPQTIVWQSGGDVFTADSVQRIQMTGRLEAHRTPIVDVIFSHDGRQMVTLSSGDNRMYQWDVVTGENIRSLESLFSRWIFWGQGDQTLAMMTPDWIFQEWKIPARDTTATAIPAPTVVVTPSTLENPTVQNTANDSLITIATQIDRVGEVGVSPNAKWAVAGGATGNIQIFSLNPLVNLGIIQAHGDQVDEIRFTAPSTRFITMNRARGEISVWNVETQARLAQLSLDEPCYSMTLSPDGQFLAVSFVNKIEIWRLDNYMRETSLFVPANTASNGIWYTPDGRFIMTMVNTGLIGFWHIESGSFAAGIELDIPLAQVLLSNDGSLLVAHGQTTDIYLWDLRPLQSFDPDANAVIIPPNSIYKPLSTPIFKMEFSPDNRYLTVADDTGDLYFFTTRF